MKKRVISTILKRVLVGTLVVSMLTGCGGAGATESAKDAGMVEAPAAAMPEGVMESAKMEAAPMEGNTNSVTGATDTLRYAAFSEAEVACPVVIEDANTEEYSQSAEKGFASVYSEPLSTFSADVDTASYSNLRRLINEGYSISELPDGAVRVEELINYFSYGDLENPKGDEPFGVTTQIMPCPWNEETHLLRVGLKTEDIAYDDFPVSNLVFLLDVSGSMYSDDKLPLLQESFALLAENLTEKDRVSIVTYAGDDAIVIEGVEGSDTKTICKAIYALEAGGSTHGSKGIETAYRLAEEYFIEGGNNRVILATDGDLNVGLTSEEELEELITEKKESGVFLSVLGFGTGNIKDNKMETLADKGNGNYAYIDSLREANKVLVEEMSATLLTVCKDVKLQVEFNPAVVKEYRLVGYDNRRLEAEDFEDDTKDAGEIGAGHCVTALYEIVTNEQIEGVGNTTKDLKYAEFYENEQGKENITWEEGSYKEYEWLTVSIRYKEPEGTVSKLLEYPVDYSDYTQNPSEDFRFVAAVAEFGLAAKQSTYMADASLKHVLEVLEEIDLTDEYKEEFAQLVETLQKHSR